MLLTDEQAREKWCPHVRARDCDDPAGNAGVYTDERSPAFARCIGSACAMWRWADGVMLKPGTGELVMDGLGGEIPAKGYCGLAGKP